MEVSNRLTANRNDSRLAVFRGLHIRKRYLSVNAYVNVNHDPGSFSRIKKLFSGEIHFPILDLVQHLLAGSAEIRRDPPPVAGVSEFFGVTFVAVRVPHTKKL